MHNFGIPRIRRHDNGEQRFSLAKTIVPRRSAACLNRRCSLKLNAAFDYDTAGDCHSGRP